MDRDSMRGLRAQPGYLRVMSAATLTRASDEMFSGGVVLVLDRTGSAGLAGADRGRAHAAEPRQRLSPGGSWPSSCLVGNGPGWVIPLVLVAAGITYPLSFGGFTSMIPAIAPGELLPPASCWASPPRVCARSCRCHSYAA